MAGKALCGWQRRRYGVAAAVVGRVLGANAGHCCRAQGILPIYFKRGMYVRESVVSKCYYYHDTTMYVPACLELLTHRAAQRAP